MSDEYRETILTIANYEKEFDTDQTAKEKDILRMTSSSMRLENEIDKGSIFRKIGLSKKDNGIFHQEEKYHRSKYGILSTFFLMLVMMPLLIWQY